MEMRYLKKFNESSDSRNYNQLALTNEEDSYIMTIHEWMENLKNNGWDVDDVIAHWAKDEYYDKNTDAHTSDPLDATHVWISYKSRQQS